MHGRRTNALPGEGLAGAGVVDAVRHGRSAADASELVRTLGGNTSTTNNGNDVLAYLTDKDNAGAMALVVARPQRDRSHVYWIVADGRGGQTVPRWVDPQQPGSFDHDARVPSAETAFWSQQLHSPDSEILVLGPDGRPIDLGGERRDVRTAGLTDAPAGGRAAGTHPSPAGKQDQRHTANPPGLQALAGEPSPIGTHNAEDQTSFDIRDWVSFSKLGLLKPRSAALVRVDAAVAALAQQPGETQRLRDVLARIGAWRDSKDGVSARDAAIGQLKLYVNLRLNNDGGPVLLVRGGAGPSSETISELSDSTEGTGDPAADSPVVAQAPLSPLRRTASPRRAVMDAAGTGAAGTSGPVQWIRGGGGVWWRMSSIRRRESTADRALAADQPAEPRQRPRLAGPVSRLWHRIKVRGRDGVQGSAEGDPRRRSSPGSRHDSANVRSLEGESSSHRAGRRSRWVMFRAVVTPRPGLDVVSSLSLPRGSSVPRDRRAGGSRHVTFDSEVSPPSRPRRAESVPEPGVSDRVSEPGVSEPGPALPHVVAEFEQEQTAVTSEPDEVGSDRASVWSKDSTVESESIADQSVYSVHSSDSGIAAPYPGPVDPLSSAGDRPTSASSTRTGRGYDDPGTVDKDPADVDPVDSYLDSAFANGSVTDSLKTNSGVPLGVQEALDVVPGEGVLEAATSPTNVPEVTAPVLTRLLVPGDGFCLLYSAIAADPTLVAARRLDLGPGTGYWLEGQNLRRALAGLSDQWPQASGSLPLLGFLTAAATALRDLVYGYLESNSSSLPPDVVTQFRRHLFPRVEADTRSMSRAELLDQVRAAGGTADAGAVHIHWQVLRERYNEVRTAELVAATGDTADAAARVAADVALTDDGNLADSALTVAQLVTYLRGAFRLADFLDEELLAYLREIWTGGEGQLHDGQVAQLLDNVHDWQQQWSDPIGEVFPLLLAHALSVRLVVHQQTGRPQEYGPDGAPTLAVFYSGGSHYDAMVPATAPAPTLTLTDAPPFKVPTLEAAKAKAPKEIDKSGDAPPPDSTARDMTEAIRQYGSKLDGTQGLEETAFWSQQLHSPDSEILVLGPDGRPIGTHKAEGQTSRPQTPGPVPPGVEADSGHGVERERLLRWLDGMGGEGVLSTLPSGQLDGVGGQPSRMSRESVSDLVRTLRDEVESADGTSLAALDSGVRDLALRLFWWRQILVGVGRQGSPGWPAGSPVRRQPRFDELAQRAYGLQSRLVLLAADERDQPDGDGDGVRWVRSSARRELAAHVAALEAALLAAEREAGPSGEVRGGTEVDHAYDRLGALLTSVEAQLTRPVAPWTPSNVSADPPGPAGRAWTPQQRYRPGRHLAPADGTRPALGMEKLTGVSALMRERLLEAALALLPEPVRGAARERIGAVLADDARLLRGGGPDLVSDGVPVDVDGYHIRLGVWLGEARQVSDLFQVRPKVAMRREDRLGRDTGHGWFADVNNNLSWAVEHYGHTSRLSALEDIGYAGLFTYVFGEQEEAHLLRTTLGSEHTIKASSYRSLLFSFAAAPWVEVLAPDGTRRTNEGPEPERVVDAVGVLAPRETSIPADVAGNPQWSPDPPSASTTVFADPAVTYRLKVDRLPVLPFNSFVEALPGAQFVRRLVEEHLEVPGGLPLASLSYRKLAGQLTPGSLRAGFLQATDGYGHQIDFGDIVGEGAATVSVHFEVTGRPTPVVLRDPYTWADASRTATGVFAVEQAVGDAIDIPPGLLLFALDFVFSWGAFEPYLFAWPTLDALVVRAGEGVDVTESSGVRFTGEPTSVVHWPASVWVVRSDRPAASSEPVPLPGGVFVRHLRADVQGWLELPALPGDVTAEGSPQLRMRPSPYLPPVIQFADVEFQPRENRPVDVAGEALRLLRTHFPGIVPAEDGSTTHHLRDVRQATENLATVVRLLRPSKLPALAGQMATADGFPIRLAGQNVSARFGDEVVVRVVAPVLKLDDAGQPTFWNPTYQRWQPLSEMDAFYSQNEDLTRSVTRVFGLWMGIEPMVSVNDWAGHLFEGPEFRPIVRGRRNWPGTQVSGFEVSGVRGVSLDDAASFTLPVVFHVSVEVRNPLVPAGLQGVVSPRQRPMPGAFLVERTATDPEQGTADPRDSRAAGPALPRVYHGESLLGTYHVLVPSVLTEHQVGIGDEARWVPHSVASGIVPGLSGPDGSPLVFEPSQEKPLPARTLIMVSGSGLVQAAVRALEQAGAGTLSATARVELEHALAAKAKQTQNLLRGPKSAWKGSVGSFWYGSRQGRVLLQFVPTRLSTVGVSDGWGVFKDFALTGVAGLGEETLTGGFFAHRQRFPMKMAGGVMVPQPQYGQRREWADVAESELSGTTATGFMAIGLTAAADVEGHFVVTAETWRSVAGIHGDRRQSQGQHVDTVGLAAMSAAQATSLGLMPAGQEVSPDTTVSFQLPEVVRRGQGLGGGSVDAPPDLSPLVHDIVDSIRERYGEALAEPVEEELDKLTDPDIAASVLDLLFDEVRQPVAVGQFLTVPVPGLSLRLPVLPGQRTVTVTMRARYHHDEFQGLLPTKHYLSHNDNAGQVARRRHARVRRHVLDLPRAWLTTDQVDPLNSMWLFANGGLFGETNRRTAASDAEDSGRGITMDTGGGERGRGVAVFHVWLELSAQVTIATAPAAAVDAMTLGALQSTETWQVPTRDPADPLEIIYDPHLLVPGVAEPPAELAGPGPVSPALAAAVVAAEPGGTSIAEGDTPAPAAWPAVEVKPGWLADANVESIEGLVDVRALASQLVAPVTREVAAGAWPWIRFVWRNYVSDPPLGSAWLRSRPFTEDFLYSVLNKAFLAGRIQSLLTSTVRIPLSVPGRLSRYDSDLELSVGIVGAQRGRSTDEVMTKRSDATTHTEDVSTDTISGLLLTPWANVEWGGASQALGYLFGTDYIGTENDKAHLRGRSGIAQAEKTTGQPFTQVHLDVRWNIAFAPKPRWYQLAWPQNRIIDQQTRRITILRPAAQADALLEAINPPGRHLGELTEEPTPWGDARGVRFSAFDHRAESSTASSSPIASPLWRSRIGTPMPSRKDSSVSSMPSLTSRGSTQSDARSIAALLGEAGPRGTRRHPAHKYRRRWGRTTPKARRRGRRPPVRCRRVSRRIPAIVSKPGPIRHRRQRRGSRSGPASSRPLSCSPALPPLPLRHRPTNRRRPARTCAPELAWCRVPGATDSG